MGGINKKYNIEIEVLTPLNIGAGAEKDWIRGVDFVVDGDTLYKLNMKKMVAFGVDPKTLESYFATKNEQGIKSQLAGKLHQVSDFSTTFPAETDNDVKTFVKNQFSNNPILAGSSLKGALRSVLFNYLRSDERGEKEVFGSATKGDEFMRFIKVSDAEFLSMELVNTKIFNLQQKGGWQGGWKHGEQKTDGSFRPQGFNTVYECIVPQQKSLTTLMMSENQFKLVAWHAKQREKKDILHNDIKFLFGIINNHTRNFLNKEKRFFKKYESDKTNLIINCIDSLLQQIPKDNSYCILRMSAGSGFHSITGDWQFDDYSINGIDTTKKVSRGLFGGRKSAKSRKIAIIDGRFYLPGFVKLRNVSDDERQRIETEIETELLRLKTERQAKIDSELQLQAAMLRAAEEKRARMLQYNELIDKAILLYDNGIIDEAKEICDQAETLCPDATRHLSIKTLIEGKLAEIAFAKQQKEKQEREQAERVRKNSVPLAEKIANSNKWGTLYGNVERWKSFNEFSDNDLQAFFAKIKEISSALRGRELTKFQDFKSWTKVVTLVGENIAKKWHEELCPDKH